MREAKIFDYIENEDILGFLGSELEERKSLSLPPFSKILKFKIENKDPNLKIGIEKIINKISKEENLLDIKINWWQDKSKKAYIRMMIIGRENWEIKKEGTTLPTEFAKKIHTLLSDFKLEINPVSVY
jgi:primosomal protein N'